MRLATRTLHAATRAAQSVFLLALLLGTAAVPLAQTTLAPGDLVVIGAVADEPDAFALLATVDIEAGTEIRVSDKGVSAAGVIQPERESIRTFTTVEAITAGQVLVAREMNDPFYPSALGTPSGGTSFISLSEGGDQLLIFQGETDDPTFIFLYSSTPFDQDYDETGGGNPTDVDQNATALPPGLTDGLTAFDLDPHRDNADYDRTNGTSGTRDEILALIANADNYTVSNDRLVLPDGDFTVMPSGGGDSALIITGIIDGPLSGGVPKAIELYATADIADLSAYGLARVGNGGGSSGEASYALTGSASAGDYLYAASEADGFTSFFGFAPTFSDAPIFVNGDDAIELYLGGTRVDVVGDPEQDGTGQPWEYSDGWAYRMDGTGPSATFDVTEWTYSGPDALDGETTNASASNPFPAGTYSTMPSGDPEVFTALALGENEVPAVETGARGGVTATLDGLTLTVTGAFAYLESDYNTAVGAHLHGGAAGENGPVRYALTPMLSADSRSGFFTADANTFMVRETFADSLRGGLVYFNLHTVGNPMGEIRGQLGTGTDDLPVALSGDQEVPPVMTTASGEATVTVASTTMTVAGSAGEFGSDYQASHVHAGARGENGPVVVGLEAIVRLDLRALEWMAEDNTFEVRSTFADSLRAGLAYINVHTADNPAGEIRGQIGFEAEAQLVSIADARTAGAGETVRIQGVVTRARGAFVYIQDETGGLAIRQTGGPFNDAVANGDIMAGTTLDITGTLSEFRGLLQINGEDLGSFEITGTEDLPPAQQVTISDLNDNGEDFEAEFVILQDVEFADAGGTFEERTSYTVMDAGGNMFTVRINNAADFGVVGETIPTGPTNVLGVVGQFTFDDPATTGYQLLPINAGDAMAVSNEALPGDALAIAVANPASGAVAVRYTVGTAAEVSFVAYDALGREVAVLAEGRTAAGEHVAEWDARGVAPGVYVLRLRAGDAQVTRTLTVVR